MIYHLKNVQLNDLVLVELMLDLSKLHVKNDIDLQITTVHYLYINSWYINYNRTLKIPFSLTVINWDKLR